MMQLIATSLRLAVLGLLVAALSSCSSPVRIETIEDAKDSCVHFGGLSRILSTDTHVPDSRSRGRGTPIQSYSALCVDGTRIGRAVYMKEQP